ncbi:hypothetical protein AJ78_05948 [Emergomyces pasteurianus Ep9510]|uniref:Mid2 domain-containing protein n=1 Tax=Emergomyces pasteurianus Ep9510 TaxID=1447872 RepID=A0A1J9QCE7_9EURO|nr:hypothetical protein AJ78_05948 [Emergomyces pasteurianus Ep9510]
MRRLRLSSTALAILSILPQSFPLAQAFPFPVHFKSGLVGRDCTPCGFYGQECCTASQTCSTNANNQAVCLDSGSSKKPRAAAEGQWETFTTTFVQTDLVTVTSVGSRLIAAPTTGSGIQCQLNLGESACGTICCTAAQACKSEGQCVEAGSSPFEPTAGPSPTPPSRPTSSGKATITAMPTATVPFLPPVGTDGVMLPPPEASTGGGGLSGGAIAGIVIGVLFGVILLFLICLSACAKGAITAILGLLGLGKKKKRGSSGSGTTQSFSNDGRPHRTWFGWPGTRPPPPRRSDSYSYYSSEKSKKSGLFGLGKWTSVGLILGALAICLGLRSKKKPAPPSSGTYTDSYYYSDYSSSSSSSSAPPRSKRSKPPPSKSRSRSTRR